jgi:multicomponent K+:H+ antiporter subunit F
VAVVVMAGMAWSSRDWFEVALLVGLLGFIGTVVMSRYLARGDIVE